MSENDVYPYKNKIKPKLLSKNLNRGYSDANKQIVVTLSDVQKFALLKYTSITKFGSAIGVGKEMASRLLSGSFIPIKPKTIRKIALALDIDELVLSQIYYSFSKDEGEK